ncbi:MAG: hypothetical protein EPO08_08960 [Rhodospirillaceae bacterium]|nr:MAG: hypothetical protein EPO08_08960 [Rhodospirillaceae bacterium]
MLRAYFRLILFLAGVVGAVILFAFAFTAGAVVLFVIIVVLALFGRSPNLQWRVVHPRPPHREGSPDKEPLTIDHDPNDLP